MINLHALIFNTYDCLDNLAWIWVKEKNIKKPGEKDLEQHEIGFALKYKFVRESFLSELRSYLATEIYKKWFENLENFRHALGHRVPPYIPPFTATEAEYTERTRLEDEWRVLLVNGKHEEAEILHEKLKKLED